MRVMDHSLAPDSSARPRRAWLAVLIVAWGVQAIVTQSLLVREALVLMFGSELAWGVVLFSWLLGVAAGAAFGGWAAGRLTRPDTGIVAVLLALSAAGCVELWVFRGARAWLDVAPGELLPLPKTALAAMLFVSPASALVGMAFPLACCVAATEKAAGTFLPERPRGAEQESGLPHLPSAGLFEFAQVYALESAGSLIGGAAFSFWAVEHLWPVQTALVCGAFTSAASAGLLLTAPRRPLGGGILAAVAVGAMLVAALAGDTLNRRLLDRRWRNVAPGYERCAEVESKYQNLAVARRGGQFTLYSNGQVAVDFPDPYTFAPLAHFWLCQHPTPRRVLVLGGGAEGLLAEILRHPIEHLDYVEPDPRQIELVRPYLAEADLQALSDLRVTVHHLDARYYVKTQRSRFDLVIARLPEPTSALRARLYTEEFYGELRQVMTARSVLCMTAKAAPGELSAASGQYLASIRATLRRHFPEITVGWGDPAQILAATGPGLTSTDPTELAARYTARRVESPLFYPLWFDGATDWLEPGKLARRKADLDAAGKVEISTDLRPVVYVQRLVLWESATGARRVIEHLRSVGLAELGAALAAVGVCALAAGRLRHGARQGWAGGAVVLSVGTTGFVTMALSIVWLFAFQNLYGYVYQRIGWIIAVFMGGLVVGCAYTNRRSKRVRGTALTPYLWRRLLGVDLLLGLLSLLVPGTLSVLGSLQNSAAALALVEWCVSLMVFATGVLGGAAFALAGGLQIGASGRPGAAAGSVVGADHAGACLGALLCGIMLVPVFGTPATAYLLAGMKLCSAALLFVCANVRPR